MKGRKKKRRRAAGDDRLGGWGDRGLEEVILFQLNG